MYAVSDRFLETVQGSHRAVARLRLCTTVQFGPDPDGLEVPILSGNVRRNANSDVKAQLQVQIPGEWWSAVQPTTGAELFAERGVSFGDGTSEYVPQGYFPVYEPEQPDAPYGPISIETDDRTARLIDTRVIYPLQIPPGTTHREIFERLVNGATNIVDEAGTYGMYGAQGGPTVPIIWDRAGYDPDAKTVTGDITVDDSAYVFLAKLAGASGAQLRFRATGELEVVATDPGPDAPYVLAFRTGRNGTLVRFSRRTSVRGFSNMVRVTGSDPAFPTGFALAYITDPASPLRWNGPLGPRVRYYASPLLENADMAAAAANTILAGSTGLPTETGLWVVPNPALDPLDVINSPTGEGFQNHTVDELTVPLVGGDALEIRTRTLNLADQTESDPEPEPDPGPGPDPDPGPGPTPGGGDPNDGTQAAVLFGWGTKIDGDEFDGASINTNKWGLYNGPGHAGNGFRRPAAFSQADGILTITGDNNDVSGGAAFKRGSYGYRVEWRCRVFQDGTSSGRPDRYHPVLILWPDNDQWPAGAEYDHFETDEGSGEFGLFMHLPNHTPYRQDHYSEPLDITQWHNYACDWNPVSKRLRAYVDGRLVYDGRGRVAEAPGPMHPTFQLDHFGGRPRRAKFQAAFIRVYTPENAA